MQELRILNVFQCRCTGSPRFDHVCLASGRRTSENFQMSDHPSAKRSGVIPPRTALEFQPAQIVYPTRTVVMHQVTDEEVTALRGTGPAISLTFFGISFGTLGSCITTLETQSLSPDSTGVFAAIAVATGFVALLCLTLFIVGLHRVSKIARTIRARAADPNHATGARDSLIRRIWRAATTPPE